MFTKICLKAFHETFNALFISSDIMLYVTVPIYHSLPKGFYDPHILLTTFAFYAFASHLQIIAMSDCSSDLRWRSG